MIETVVYTTQKGLDEVMNSTKYVVDGLVKDGSFNVNYATDLNSDLAENADVVFLRLDPPIHNGKEVFLEELANKYSNSNKLFLNDPNSILRLNSKDYLLEFEKEGLIPETIITDDYKIASLFVKDFGRSNQKVIAKPKTDYGGNGIKLIEPKQKSRSELEEEINSITQGGKKEMVFQRFIKEVANYGDKRIHMIFNYPVSAAVRYPKKGGFICNISRGGYCEKSRVEEKDYKILESVLPFLKDNNIHWAGIDIIGPYLGEINLTQPALMHQTDNINNNTKTRDYLINKIKMHTLPISIPQHSKDLEKIYGTAV